MRKVEYACLCDDNTWDTTVVDVPEDVGDNTDALQDWANMNLSTQPQYRKIVLFAVYNSDVTEDYQDDEPPE